MRSPTVSATLLSLCFTIGIVLPTITASAVPLPPSSLASPLYRRVGDGDDPGKVQEQVDDLFKFLSEKPDSKIQPRKRGELKTYISGVNDALKKANAKDKKLRVLFVQYMGSGGDVGKSMTYTNAIKEPTVGSTHVRAFQKVMQFFRKRTRQQKDIKLKLVVDCNSVQYMSKAVQTKWDKHIKKCSEVNSKNSKENLAQFMKNYKDTLKAYNPHVIIQGNAMKARYKSDPEFWDTFHQEMNQAVTNDEILRINIRADFKLEEEANQKKDQFPIEKNDVVLVGQPVDFYPGLPSRTRQTRIGRPRIETSAEIAKDLSDWMDKQKNIMYVGLGGPQRSIEYKKEEPTKALDQFISDTLVDEEDNDWSFLLFHNKVRDAGDEEKNPKSDDGRVYHLWNGINSLAIFKHKNMRIALSHCGRGTLDDTIEAGLVPICVGEGDFSDDQFELAAKVEERKMGKGITKKEDGIKFKGNSNEDGWTGEQLEFCPNPSLRQMFKDVKGSYEDMKKKVLEVQAAIVADTSGDLAFEIMYALKYYQVQRSGMSSRL